MLRRLVRRVKEFLTRLVDWVHGSDDDPVDELPGFVTLFLEVDMSNLKIVAVLPTVGPRQRALKEVRVEVKVDGSDVFDPMTVLPVAAGATSVETTQENINPGSWTYRAAAVDADDKVGAWSAEAVVAVPFDGPGVVVLNLSLE